MYPFSPILPSHPGCRTAWNRVPCPNKYLLKACYMQVTVLSIRDRNCFKTWHHPFPARDLIHSLGMPRSWGPRCPRWEHREAGRSFTVSLKKEKDSFTNHAAMTGGGAAVGPRTTNTSLVQCWDVSVIPSKTLYFVIKSRNIWADEVGEEWQGWREEYGRRSKRAVAASDKPPFTLRGSKDTASARPASGCGPSDLPVRLSCHPKQTSASAAPWGPGAVLTGACSLPLMYFPPPHDGVEKSMWDRLWFVIL